jgi:dimethylhistidine N-methyltransferase
MNDTMMLESTIEREPMVDSFLSEMVYGLSQAQKILPCKFLYDEEGSRLFNEICELDEYYPTRTESRILCDNIDEIVASIGGGCRLVEFGSGASTKTRHLLNHLQDLSSYLPIDISGAQLLESSTRLAREFPDLEIQPLEADYGELSELPASGRKSKRTVAFFSVSTIGNFEPGKAVAFLGKVASLCGAGGGLLIGVDRRKDKRLLEAAYNDRSGVTARFNLNLLARANRELDADFDLSSFLHRAPYNEYQGRIEMHLVSTRPQVVHLNSHEFYFARGEHITTEYSYKYSVPGFANLAKKAGFELVKSWEDAEQLFSVMLLRVKPRSWRKMISSASPGAIVPVMGGQHLNDDTILEAAFRKRSCRHSHGLNEQVVCAKVSG